MPHTHDLVFLTDRLPAEVQLPFDYDLRQFNDFAAIRRYERGFLELDQIDLEAAIQFSGEVLAWLKQKIEASLSLE